MRNKKQKMLTKKLLLAQSSPRYWDIVWRGEMGFSLRTLPEVQRLHTETSPPVVRFRLHSGKQDLCALVKEQYMGKGAWISSLLITYRGGPMFWVAVLHYMFCSVLCGHLSGEESESPRKTTYSVLPLWLEAQKAVLLCEDSTVTKSPACSWELLILYEA